MAKLKVKVRPQAGRTRILGFLDDGTLRVELKAPPERGKANQALVELLSRRTGIPASSIRILSGRSGRTKHLALEGVSESELRELLP